MCSLTIECVLSLLRQRVPLAQSKPDRLVRMLSRTMYVECVLLQLMCSLTIECVLLLTGWPVCYHELGHAQLQSMYRGEMCVCMCV